MPVPKNWPELPGGWPPWLWTVPYSGKDHPLAQDLPTIASGANCQRYAYAVLALFGRLVPPLRSSELWDDDTSLLRIDTTDAAPLDLVLFSEDSDPYGAHVAVLMAPDALLHLCAEVGLPAVWFWGDFGRRPRYATTVGVLRLRTQ